MARLGLGVSWGHLVGTQVLRVCYKRGSDIGYEWLLSLGLKDLSTCGEGNNHRKNGEASFKGQAQDRATSCLGLRVGL